RADFRSLRPPFLGDGGGERRVGHDQLALGRGAQRLAVERDAPAARDRAGCHLVVDASHAVGSSSANGSGASPAKPKNAHIARICGGSGALTRNTPPRGRGISSVRACRWSCAAAAPPGRNAAAPPYLPSPRIGVPIAAQCARSWCVRPVIGSSASQLARDPAASITA